MNNILYMTQLHLDMERLIRFAEDNGINNPSDEDFGYLAHAWMMAAFNELAMKPYRLFYGRKRESSVKLLGYTTYAPEKLKEHVQTFAEPSVASIFDIAELENTKKMPKKWSEGRRLGFETLVLPVTRKDNKEKDVYLRKVGMGKDAQQIFSREKVYLEWLQKQLGEAAGIKSFKLEGFRLTGIFRRHTRTKEKGRRSAPFLKRPQALMTGTLVIKNQVKFAELLARGLGRHRAFGYGMLLLKPPR